MPTRITSDPAEEAFIDAIYEAAVVVDRWPIVLQNLADHYGAGGAMLFSVVGSDQQVIVTDGFAPTFERYVAEGYMSPNERAAPLVAEHAPCFRSNADYRTAAQRAAMPVYRDLLIPAGFEHAVGTVVQGPHHSMLAMTLEGMRSEDAAKTCASLAQSSPPASGACAQSFGAYRSEPPSSDRRHAGTHRLPRCNPCRRWSPDRYQSGV